MSRARFGVAAAVLVAVAGVASPSPSPVWAASGKKVGVHVRGKGGPAIEKQIAQVLKRHGLAPVAGRPLAAAARGLHAGLDSDEHLAAVAHRLRLGAIVVGDVRDHGARAQVRAHGADGAVIAEGAWSVAGGGRKLAAAVGRSVWSRIGPALEGAESAAPAKRSRKEAAPEPVAEAAPLPPPEPLDARPPSASPLRMETPGPPRAPPAAAPAASDAEGSEFGGTPSAHPAARARTEAVESEAGEPAGAG